MPDLRGWFNFAKVYDWVVEHFAEELRREAAGSPDTSIAVAPVLVEVGVFKGASLIHLCRRLLEEMGGGFELFAVDTWEMKYVGGEGCGPEYNLQIDELVKAGKRVLDVFIDNLKFFEIQDHVEIMCMDSARAIPVIKFADFVFIDGDHNTQSVIQDIQQWKEKCTILAGHDAYQSSVREALEYCFGVNGYYASVDSGGCWTTHPELGEFIVGLSRGTEHERHAIVKGKSNGKTRSAGKSEFQKDAKGLHHCTNAQ